MKNPSCKRQRETVIELFNAADARSLQVKSHNPKPVFSAVHAKTWRLDGQVYIGGKFNLTHNADASNEERLVVFREDHIAQVHERWSDEFRSKAKALTREGVAEQLVQLRSKSESKSASLPRGLRAAKSADASGAGAAVELLALPPVPMTPSPPESPR